MGKTILTPEQHQILEFVVSSPKITTSFYLTGGTALSEFYFQHRLSEDFDFFSEQPLVESDILAWVKKCSQAVKVTDVEYQSLHQQLTFFFHFPKTVVKIDFSQYPFPHLGEYKKYQTLRIASLVDIGVNKVQAIQTRKRGRDFFDLYLLLTKGKLDTRNLLESYRTKFDITISPQELAKQYMGVLEAIDQPKFIGKVDWSEIETFFLQEVRALHESFLK